MADKILDAIIHRTNQLVDIKKKRPLTSDEKKERKHLLVKFAKRYRANLKSRLEHIKFHNPNVRFVNPYDKKGKTPKK